MTKAAPWTRKNPKKTSTKMTEAQRAAARAAAKRAGRPYPNLIDNMNAMKRNGAVRLKDPKGGLTAAGRAKLRRTEHAKLKPGVKKAARDMTPQEMKRKGSWAARFYGRDVLPPLVDEQGKPTRFAKTAAAWGEPVPRTVAAARKIAAKGRRLLAKYKARKG